MSSVELILRTVGIVQLALLAGLMLRARRRDNRTRFGAALCISVGTFMVTSMPGAAEMLGVFVYPLIAICSTHPVWFWLFCAALFSDDLRLSRAHVICLVGMVITGPLCQSMLEPGWQGDAAWLVKALGLAFGAASLAFACLAPITVFAGQCTDLDERLTGALITRIGLWQSGEQQRHEPQVSTIYHPYCQVWR